MCRFCCSANSRWEVRTCLYVHKYHPTSRELCLISPHPLSPGVGSRGNRPTCNTLRSLLMSQTSLFIILSSFYIFLVAEYANSFLLLCPLVQAVRPLTVWHLESLLSAVQAPLFDLGCWGGGGAMQLGVKKAGNGFFKLMFYLGILYS